MLRGKSARLVLLTTVILVCSSHSFSVAAQSEQDDDLRKRPGRVIFQGHNTKAVGPHKVLTFKLEALDLSQPLQIASYGVKRQVSTVYRLTIKGEMHQTYRSIWIDDVLFWSPWESDAFSIATLIYDPSPLRNGATISIGSGSEMSDLPERLKLPADFTKPWTEDPPADGNGVTGIRTLLKADGKRYERFVVLEIATTASMPVINNRYSLQIGRKFFSNLIGSWAVWRVEMTARDFAELKDGARISVNMGPLPLAYLGRLDKRMLDR